MWSSARQHRVLLVLIAGATSATSTLVGGRLVLTDEQIATYERDGVLLVKGVLTGRRLRRVQRSAERVLSSKVQITPSYRLIDFQGWRNNAVLRDVACDGTVPDLVAQAMRLRPNERLRVLKDALLAFRPGDGGCGWHVDDKFFWPCHDAPPDGETRLEGVNVWITLTPLRAVDGGGLAVVPGSARAHWRERARKVIAGEMGGGRGPPRTCAMADLSPATHRRFERTKKLHDMEAGDALLHSRYCFHRGQPFDYGDTKLRYSIRYMPEGARIFNNGFESVLSAKKLQGGESLAACGEFYPQVWPKPLWRERMLIRLGRIAEEAIPRAPPPK